MNNHNSVILFTNLSNVVKTIVTILNSLTIYYSYNINITVLHYYNSVNVF